MVAYVEGVGRAQGPMASRAAAAADARNAGRKRKDGKLWTPADFMPAAPAPRQSWQEQMAVMQALRAARGQVS